MTGQWHLCECTMQTIYCKSDLMASQSKWNFLDVKSMVFGRLFERSSNWTVQINNDSPSISIYIHLDVPEPSIWPASTWTTLNRPFGLCPFGRPCTINWDASKYTNRYCPFGQNLAVHLDDSRTYNWTAKIHGQSNFCLCLMDSHPVFLFLHKVLRFIGKRYVAFVGLF